MKKLFVLLSVCFYMSAFAAGLEKLQADLQAALPNDQAGVAVGYISPEAESALFVGNSSLADTTLFEYGSVTKVLTAILLAELDDESVVELTDSLNVYLPEDVRNEKWQGVTL